MSSESSDFTLRLSATTTESGVSGLLDSPGTVASQKSNMAKMPAAPVVIEGGMHYTPSGTSGSNDDDVGGKKNR